MSARDGSILIVCSGNVCCSPYVERLLRSEFAGTDIRVSSAGTQALVGSGMEPLVGERLAKAGADPAGFTARELTQGLVRTADLVLCATRAHRSAVVRLAPLVLRRTYALADFSDLAAQVDRTSVPDPGRSGDVGGNLGSFVRGVSAAVERARGQVRVRTVAEAAIIDPYRQPHQRFNEMFAQVEKLLPPIVALFVGNTRPSGRISGGGSN